MLKFKRTHVFAVIFLCLFVFSGSAYGLRFTGDAWVAEHYSGGERTGEYYLVVDSSNMGEISKVRLQGFKLSASDSQPDFYYLTGNSGTEGATYFEINPNSGLIRSYKWQAMRKSNWLVKKGLLTKAARQDWIDEYVDTKLESRLFNLVFKEDGRTYSGRIGFATFENPVDYSEIGQPPAEDGGAAPVPEPGTMLLMGTGLLGLAALRRRFR